MMPGFYWEAPDGCLSEALVKEAVRTLVRTGSEGGDARSCDRNGGPPWTARIRFESGDERGDRELAASTCEALGQAVALVVALAIDRAETAPTIVFLAVLSGCTGLVGEDGASSGASTSDAEQADAAAPATEQADAAAPPFEQADAAPPTPADAAAPPFEQADGAAPPTPADASAPPCDPP